MLSLSSILSNTQAHFEKQLLSLEQQEGQKAGGQVSTIAETLHCKGCSYPKALRVISTQDGKTLPKSLGLMKNHTLQQSHFSALLGPALKPLLVLGCISSVCCFSPLPNNQVHFL